MASQASKLSPAEVATICADAKGWKPEVGQEVQGPILAVKTGESEYGKYPIIFVLNEDATATAVHAFHTVLSNELKSQRPQVGENIFISFLGTDPTQEVKKGNSPTVRYAVHVEREGTGSDPWDHI